MAASERQAGEEQDDARAGQAPEWVGSLEPESAGPDVTSEPVQEAEGNDNIAEGRVGGLMGGPHGSQGQGQGG